MSEKRLFVFLSAASLISVLCRCFQLLCLTEEGTGFIMEQYKFLGYAVNALIAAVIVSVCFAASTAKTLEFKRRCGVGLLVISVLAAILITAESFTLPYYKGLPIVFRALSATFAILAGAVMVCFAWCKFKKQPFNGMLFALPCACGFIRLVLSFALTSKIATVNDNVIELAFLCTSLLFLLYFGQLKADAFNEKTHVKMAVMGVAAVTLALTASIPKIVVLAIGNGMLVNSSTTNMFTDLMLGIYILSLIYGAVGTKE